MGLLLQALGLGPAILTPGASLAPPGSGTAPAGAPTGRPAAKTPSDALDAKLGTELDKLASTLDGIHDDAVAAPLRAAMQKVIDGRVAASTMAEAKRMVAVKALIATAQRQGPVAAAALRHAQAVDRREAARKDIDVILGQVTALVLGGINDDALRKRINDGLTPVQADFRKADKIADLARSEKALLALRPAAMALLGRAEKAKATTDWRVDVWKPLLERTRATVAAIVAPAVRTGLQAKIAALEAEVATRVAAADVAALRATVEPALSAIETQARAVTRFEAGFAAIRPAVDAASAYFGAANGALTAAQVTRFGNAKAAVDQAVARGDWAAASSSLAALRIAAAAVLKSRDDKSAYDAAMNALLADRARVTAALASPGLPAAAANAYAAGFAAITQAETGREWAAALAAVPAYRKALKTALDALEAGKKFYALYQSVRAEDEKASSLLRETDNPHQTDERLSALGSHYSHYKDGLGQAVGRGDWEAARALLADVQISAREFIAAAASHAAARKPYDDAVAALRFRAEAERVAAAVTAPYAATAGAYVKQRQAVYTAADSSDFKAAIAGLPALQARIDALMEVKNAQDAARGAFTRTWGDGDYGEALAVAKAEVPALAASVHAFRAADQAVETAKKIPDWVAAQAGLPALQAAATRLVKDKAAFNGAATPGDAAAFEAKMKALEPRLGQAADAPVPPFVDTLQKTVTTRQAEIADATRKKDLARAESDYAKLLADLDAMEAAKARLAAHQARFMATKNGDVAKSLAVVLTPAALIAERAAAVARTEASIAAQAATGDTKGADARLAPWALEAKGWERAQGAFAELHSGKVPSVDVLSKLAAEPGGDRALDDLILALPANTPANVVGAALKARFGFDVKRFTSRNDANIPDLTGLQAHDDKQSDPELVAMYQLLSRIPSKRLKGKVVELVDFDSPDNNGGGVYYPNKKIFVYGGQIGQNPQAFSRDEEILPKGEAVQENCKPNPKAPTMPAPDQTLLHEIAHAEDRGSGFMDKRWDKPEFGNWHAETPETIATVAAPHLRYDRDWILAVLKDKGCKPPSKTPKPPKGVKPDDWETRRQAALLWCESIRADNNPWWKGAVCARIQIGGRVYHEAYDDGRWRSYDYAARSQGISGYQFRAEAEWFAELYAAYFGGVLKDSHPAMGWLKAFEPTPT